MTPHPCDPITRRAFLQGAAGLAVHAAFHAGGITRALPAVQEWNATRPIRPAPPSSDTLRSGEAEHSTADTFTPEYASSLEEVLFVYDQVGTGYFFEEVLHVINNLPPRSRVYFLTSKGRADEAVKLFDKLDMRSFEVIAAPTEKLWGDWGRDIFMLGWRDGKRAALVPFNKRARSRGELTRGYEILKRLERPRIDVYLAPVSYEGGNLCYDIIDGEKVLFTGNSAVLETIALYRYWFAKEITEEGAIELFRRAFDVDRVIPLGRCRGSKLFPQAAFTFHIDMGMTIPMQEKAVVASFDPAAADEEEIQEEFTEELEYWLADLGRTAQLAKTLEEKGIRLKLPRGKDETKRFVRSSLQRELEDLRMAAEEMEAYARTLGALGYTVLRIETDWRHVRKYQSYTNVLPSADRLIMPIFPKREYTRSRSVPLPSGRTMVGIVPGERPNEYVMEGLNLAAYRFYSDLVGGVRVVEDYFYTLCGNVHCIAGRLS